MSGRWGWRHTFTVFLPLESLLVAPGAMKFFYIHSALHQTFFHFFWIWSHTYESLYLLSFYHLYNFLQLNTWSICNLLWCILWEKIVITAVSALFTKRLIFPYWQDMFPCSHVKFPQYSWPFYSITSVCLCICPHDLVTLTLCLKIHWSGFPSLFSFRGFLAILNIFKVSLS